MRVNEEAVQLDYKALLSPERLVVAENALGEIADQVLGRLGAGPDGIPPRLLTAVEDGGLFDFCAWYQPIHFFGYDWGIFVREDCIVDLATTIACFMPRSHPAGLHYPGHHYLVNQLVLAGFLSYFFHEHFHHKVESFGIRLWVVEKTARYVPYKHAVYRPTYPSKDNLEEALANADSYRRFGTRPYTARLDPDVRKALRAALRFLFSLSPPGYREASRYLAKPEFEPALWKLQAQIQDASLTPSMDPRDWEFAPRSIQSFLNVASDIWLVVRVGRVPILPHVAPVRTPSTREAAKLLRQRGYTELSGAGKGSHRKFVKEGEPTIILPAKRERLSPGVAKNVAHALGLSGLGELLQAV